MAEQQIQAMIMVVNRGKQRDYFSGVAVCRYQLPLLTVAGLAGTVAELRSLEKAGVYGAAVPRKGSMNTNPEISLE